MKSIKALIADSFHNTYTTFHTPDFIDHYNKYKNVLASINKKDVILPKYFSSIAKHHEGITNAETINRSIECINVQENATLRSFVTDVVTTTNHIEWGSDHFRFEDPVLANSKLVDELTKVKTDILNNTLSRNTTYVDDYTISDRLVEVFTGHDISVLVHIYDFASINSTITYICVSTHMIQIIGISIILPSTIYLLENEVFADTIKRSLQILHFNKVKLYTIKGCNNISKHLNAYKIAYGSGVVLTVGVILKNNLSGGAKTIFEIFNKKAPNDLIVSIGDNIADTIAISSYYIFKWTRSVGDGFSMVIFEKGKSLYEAWKTLK